MAKISCRLNGIGLRRYANVTIVGIAHEYDTSAGMVASPLVGYLQCEEAQKHPDASPPQWG